MRLDEAEALAKALISQHLGDGTRWRFRWDDGIRRFGRCSYGDKVISLSRKLTEVNDLDQVRCTITHEIAHAICGPAHGHDAFWATTHRRLGGDGRARYSPRQVRMVSRTTQFRLS